MCVREGKEFEEHFPHLGVGVAEWDGVLKSPFNRGRRRDDDDSILSVLRQSEAEGTREEIGRKKAEQLLKFSKKRMCRWWPTNLYISTLNRTFMESMRQ